ncbi:hypothetical protein KKA00_03475 [bacterium]|nr:hypothetical protein [bacterium]MBU1651254.1 hypothetical protein [bacterium]MBU1881292.1 hypothetical protein [bacterium]
MARILYISPEHISGTLSLFQRGHIDNGHECRFATFFPASSGFPEDICLNLPLMPDSGWIKALKSRAYQNTPEMLGQADRPGNPPIWRPNTAAEAVFFFLRDLLIAPRVKSAVKQHHLDQFDVIHLEQGLDFFRDARFARKMKERGAKIVCFYHGTDLRNRGVLPAVDKLSDLNLTSELDLLKKHPHIKYLHLPFDVDSFTVKEHENDPLIIGHACRGPAARHFKGTDQIIAVVKELEWEYPVKLDFVEGVSHDACLQRKANWDIAIDQIADVGGWGYGMNSLESLSMRIPTCTRMRPECDKFFTDHPFINVTPDTLKNELICLIEDRSFRQKKAQDGLDWVKRTHALSSVMARLYDYYEEAGIFL